MNAFESLLKSLPPTKVIDVASFVKIDLSESNKTLSEIDITDAYKFEEYIEKYLSQNKAEAAFGGYIEHRSLYLRSTIFNDDEADERNIHIGLDLWIKDGTPVLAAVDGIIHSFNNNLGVGDYGPTIILEHTVNESVFYTLYGHLSLESLDKIQIGTPLKKGQQLGTLGDASVNGDYAPHLHFQIIKKIVDYFGDYPGVCSKNDLSFYLENCPDPNLLLKINE
jgi:murein DD-endopeptidase MepM/ murein hydrolase activator NlpD